MRAMKARSSPRPRLRFGLAASLVIAALTLTATFITATIAQERPPLIIERGLEMKTRDGVTLRADVYRPRADGKFPVILTRTPYDKSGAAGTCTRVAEAGYVCVAQDVRGRWSSEGEWYPFKHESEDGYDTIEWLAHLPWSTGVIGMWGGSYVGATQMLAAIARPPHLAGIFPTITASNYHENWTYQGGAFEQWFNESWTSGLAEDTLRRRVNGHVNALNWAPTLPLANYPVIDAPDTKNLAPYFQDWLAHPDYDDYWKQWAIDADYSRINIPAYHVGAWYDIFLGGTIKNFQGLKAGAGNFFAKENQRMVIEIGGHSGGGPKIGDLDFGPNSQWDQASLIIRWYDYLFKHAPNGMDKEKPVRVFAMGTNQWRDFDTWPPPNSQAQRMYLHSGGKANSSAGDGSLSPAAPAQEPPDNYSYDPTNPVPTRGGPLCCQQNLLLPGPKDQSDIEKRSDVLIYTTQPLDRDFDVTGPVTLELWVKSSAVSTDFTGKLVDVWPNGFAQNITEGILRLRKLDQDARQISIDLWATSNVFLAGHRLRLEVSSSNFPRFDRNLNTGDPDIAHATKTVVAQNTIVHDKQHPSSLVLSVLPRN
jgi:putative CocE/NonD family hydrolase